MYATEKTLLTPTEHLMTDSQKEKMNQCLEWTKKWRNKLGIHPDYEINLEYHGDQEWLMWMNDDHAFYNKFGIHISSQGFDDSCNDNREMIIIHEMIHIILWQFRKFCTTVANEKWKEAIWDREELVVSHLELAIARLVEDSKMT